MESICITSPNPVQSCAYIERTISVIHARTDNLALIHENATYGRFVDQECFFTLSYILISYSQRQKKHGNCGVYHLKGLLHEELMALAILHYVCMVVLVSQGFGSLRFTRSGHLIHDI